MTGNGLDMVYIHFLKSQIKGKYEIRLMLDLDNEVEVPEMPSHGSGSVLFVPEGYDLQL